MERPIGVTIIAVFEFFITILLIIIAVASAMGASVLGAILARTSSLGADPGFAVFAGTGIIVAALLSLPAAAFAVLGFGMWNLRNWARVATMILAVLGAVGASVGFVWALMHFRILGVMVTSIRLGIDLLVLWYLSQARVRRSFLLAG